MVSKSSEQNVLTSPQQQVLRFIKDQYELLGVSPSYREIQHHLGYQAIGTVQDHVKALIKKGCLERASLPAGRNARTLVPRGYKPERTARIPIFGEIAAGGTRDSAQVELGTMFVADSFARDSCFALRVVGNSMIDAGIFEGDYLIVDGGATVADGDIVVALLNKETTVKRLQKKDGEILLIPENRLMEPIAVRGNDHFEIQGKVIGLQRKL